MAGNHNSGRRPKPTALKVFEGTRKDRINQEEPQYAALDETFDVPPAELEGDAVASAEWRRLAPRLRESGVAAEVDRSALVAACLEWSRYLTATKDIAARGMVIQAPNGGPILNPCLSIATKALAACNRLWPELGLTPSSRSRLKTVGAPADNPLRAFLAKGYRRA